MSDNILEQLRANNPFAFSASPLPWENMTPDLQQLNRATSDEIEQLIRYKRREPYVPLAGLVFGSAGMGKTHMLTRILRRMRKNAWPAIFVTVRIFTNPKRVTQELLSEIFICLTKLHSGDRSQFDLLMNEMMNVYHEHRKNDGFSNTDKIDLKIYLKRDMPEIDRVFLKCILTYIGTSDRTVKDEILEWLRAGLDDEDSLKFGLPMRDMNSMNDAECESMAKNILTSLGVVLSYAHIPMIICFDELDAMLGHEDVIQAWGNVVGMLMNNIKGILPLCFVKNEVWETFQPVLNLSMIQRLRNNTMVMKGTCSVPQAKQLIHDRIASVFKEGAEEKYQFLISRMNNVIKPGLSPRMVIELANKALKGSSPVDPIREAYDEERKKVQAEQNIWPPNADHINVALRAWLGSLGGFEVIDGKGKHKYITLRGVWGGKKFAFIVLIPKIHSTAIAGLSEGMKFMKEYPGSFCYYIKEAKAHKKTWKKFADKLANFESAGGHTMELDNDSRVSWYALTALITRINSKDVNIYLPSGTRQATMEDAKEFLSSLQLIPDVLKHRPGHEDGHKDPKPLGELEVALRNIISSSPMNILTVDKVLELLVQRNISVSRTELLAFIDSHKDEFRTYKSANDVMLAFAKR